LITYFYRIAPWDIPRLTLYQWQDYMEKIAEIVELFQPKQAGKGKVEENKDQRIKRLRAMATTRKQKLLRKGIKI